MKKGIDYPGVAVVFICHDGQGQIIMNRRSAKARDEHGTWDIGGGGVDHGEKLEETLKREVMEEYCSPIVNHEYIGYRDVHRTHGGAATHWVVFDYVVQIDREKAGLGDPEKMDEIKWFRLDKMPPYSERHSQAPVFWELYEEKLNSVIGQKIRA